MKEEYYTQVQYATEGLSQNLFVSKYRLQLPSEDDIKQYLLENISEEKFKELKEEEKTQSKVHKRDGSFCVLNNV